MSGIISIIIAAIGLTSSIVGIIGLFVHVKETIEISKAHMAILIIGIFLLSLGVIQYNTSFDYTDDPGKETETASLAPTDSLPPESSPTVEPWDEPPPEGESTPLIPPESTPPVASSPANENTTFLLDAYCEDEPSFTDYKVEVMMPDGQVLVYYPYELPTELVKTPGTYHIFIKRQTSENMLLYSGDLTLVDNDSISSYSIRLYAPVNILRFCVYCKNDPTFTDYLLEIYSPDGQHLFYTPEQLPAELPSISGEYSFYIIRRSTGETFNEYKLDNTLDPNDEAVVEYLLSFEV